MRPVALLAFGVLLLAGPGAPGHDEAMARVKLALTCTPTAARFPVGSPLTVRLTLRNESDEAVEIPAVGLPWHSFYAATFTVTNRSDVDRVLPQGLPMELPSETVPAGEALSGEVDLGAYLQLADRRSIAQVPGRYEVEGRVLTSARLVSGDRLEDLRLRCGPFTVAVG
jgi:hypothetical protein